MAYMPAKGIKIQGSGYLLIPAAAGPVAVTSGAGTWTNGAYTQLLASTSEADYLLGILVYTISANDFELDIATGGAGSETVVSTVPGYETSNAGYLQPVYFPYPIAVATTTRIAARARHNTASSDVRVKLIYCKQADLVPF
jgi:hypothetical protein